MDNQDCLNLIEKVCSFYLLPPSKDNLFKHFLNLNYYKIFPFYFVFIILLIFIFLLARYFIFICCFFYSVYFVIIYLFIFLIQKPLGIATILDEESRFPQATDTTFLDKLHANFEKNPKYSKPKISKSHFGIRHYAGLVEYCVDGFLDKNRDSMPMDMCVLTPLSSLAVPSI